jgi:hypothetical protein
MTEIFIQKAILKQGNIYDYSKVDYKKAIEKVIIICKIHGEFEQTPNNHLGGSGCINCIDRTKRKDNIEDFIKKAILIHGDNYDYSKFIYINCKTKGIIICKIHGEFEQQPSNHLQGKKCSKCSGCYKPTTQEFIENSIKIHGNDYDYSKVEYIDNKTKVIIICKIHGEFEQQPSSHLQGNGCIICSGVYKKNTEDFIEIAKKKHGDIYDYSKVEYTGCKIKIKIICKKHGEFEQTPDSHLRGCGCNKCADIVRQHQRLSNNEEFIEKSKIIHCEIYNY